MPIRYTKTRRRRKKPMSKGKTTRDIAIKALETAKKLDKLVKIEWKIIDDQSTAITVAVTPTIFQVTNLGQGDLVTDRTGNMVHIKSFQMKYWFEQHPSSIVTALRVLVIVDKQTNGGIYSAGDILKDVTVDDGITSLRKYDQKSRFNVLYDRVHFMSDTASKGGSASWYKTMSLKIKYDSDNETIADLVSNSISVMVLSNEAINAPVLTIMTRSRFIDA